MDGGEEGGALQVLEHNERLQVEEDDAMVSAKQNARCKIWCEKFSSFKPSFP